MRMPAPAALRILMLVSAASVSCTTAPATTPLSCKDMNRQFDTRPGHWGRMPKDSPLRARWLLLKCKGQPANTTLNAQ